MKLATVSIVMLIIFFGCKKYKNFDDDVAGSSYIRGRLFLYDTITKNSNGLPLPDKTIRLFYQEASDTINYLFSTTTDSAGYFVFSNLKEGSLYKIFYDEKNDTNNIIYKAREFNVKPKVEDLRLIANIDMEKGQGIIYTVIDAITKKPVKNAKVCVYNNTTFFQEGKCEGSVYESTTDVNGKAYFFGIPQAIYQATAYTTINNIIYVGNNTENIDNTVKQPIIELGAKQTTETGYNILVIDSSGDPVPNAQLCFFTSRVLFNADTCSGSNFQDTSDLTGYAKQTGVSPGKYYILANLKISDSLSLTGKESINVTKDIITSDTIIVRIR